MSIWDRSLRIRVLESNYARLESLLNVQVAVNMEHTNLIIQLESHGRHLDEELLAAKRDIAFLRTENEKLRDDITPDDDNEDDDNEDDGCADISRIDENMRLWNREQTKIRKKIENLSNDLGNVVSKYHTLAKRFDILYGAYGALNVVTSDILKCLPKKKLRKAPKKPVSRVKKKKGIKPMNYPEVVK